VRLCFVFVQSVSLFVVWTLAAVEDKQLRGVLLALEGKIAAELATVIPAGGAGGASAGGRGGGGGGGGGRGGGGGFGGGPNKAELVKPGEALFEMFASLRIVEEGALNSKQMLLDVIKDAVLLLAGEAAAAGRRSRSKASSYRLSEIGDCLDKAFRVRRDG
jgi:hypothetical protein